MKKKWLIVLFLSMSFIRTYDCFGQMLERNIDYTSDSTAKVVFHFRFDKSILDYGYMDNAKSLEILHGILSDEGILSGLDSIVIEAASSPDGNHDHNRALAKRRAADIKRYMLWKYPAVSTKKIRMHSIGEDWDGLRRFAESDTLMPFREKVLEVIDQDVNLGTKEWRLRRVGQGSAWNYITIRYLKYLRAGSARVVFFPKVKAEEPIPLDTETREAEAREPFEEKIIPVDTVVEVSSRPRFGIHTNLLAWGALMPNLGVEYFFNPRWSMGVNVAYTWIELKNQEHREKLWYVSPELYYHFGSSRSPWGAGHYLSVYGQASHFNMMWHREAMQGSLYGGGIGYGYNLMLDSHWLLSFSFGVGAWYMDYDRYRQWPNEKDKQDNEFLKRYRRVYLGPTKVNVGVGYYF